jgi:HD-like signal output (HDOD) protein
MRSVGKNGPLSSRQDPRYGRGQHSIDVEWQPEGVIGKLRDTFRSPTYRPPVLPSVALELTALARREDIQIKDVLRLLEQDSLIAGGVLKLAQSPLYQRGGQLHSLAEAVTRLGMRTLADLCWSAALNARVFRAPGYDAAMEELRRHSAACAQLARLIGAFVTFPDDYTYLCGLMHDVGAAACLTLLGDVPRGTARPPLELVWPAVKDMHQEASELLVRAWELPEDVRLIVGHHHHLRIGGKVHPVVATVALADSLASELGAATSMDSELVDAREAAKALGLSATTLDKIKSSAERLVAELE